MKCEKSDNDISDKDNNHNNYDTKNKKSQKEKDKNKKIIIIVVSIILILTIGILYFNFNHKNEKNDKLIQSNYRDESIKQVMIITDYINIREKEDVNSNLLGKVYKDEIYTVLGENNDSSFHWIYIETTNGIKGYISGNPDYILMLDVKVDDKNNNIIPDEDNSNNDNNNTNNNGDNKPVNNSNSSNNSGTENNNNTNNNNSNINNNENTTTEPVTKKCFKTCDKGYELKNGDSADCYCEKIKANVQVIDATKVYYCTGNFKLKNNNLCEYVKYSNINISSGCSFGYELSEDGSKCIGIVKEDTTPKKVPTCIGGSDKDLFQMTAAPGYGCRRGKLSFYNTCPRGYELIAKTYCRWKYSGKETYVSSNCTSEYPVADKESGKCVDRISKSASIKYTCPDDFILNGTKCYKNN